MNRAPWWLLILSRLHLLGPRKLANQQTIPPLRTVQSEYRISLSVVQSTNSISYSLHHFGLLTNLYIMSIEIIQKFFLHDPIYIIDGKYFISTVFASVNVWKHQIYLYLSYIKQTFYQFVECSTRENKTLDLLSRTLTSLLSSPTWTIRSQPCFNYFTLQACCSASTYYN